MKKAKFPTSEYKVSCDVFDTSLEAKLHQPDSLETKLKLTMKDKHGEEISLSLYAEDVRMLSRFLSTVQSNVDYRD